MKMKSGLAAILAIAALIVSACQNPSGITDGMQMHGGDKEFEELCISRTPDNWMKMKPMMDGKLMETEDDCWGCMSDDGMTHFCSIGEYKEYLKLQ